jgi:hypothetical protein
MKITNILIEHQMATSRKILAESCQGLTEAQTLVVRGIYREMQPLIEASLTAQQIQSIFGEVEKAAAASGNNRTMLGKGVDVAKKADEVINNIGKWLQNTTPVAAFDQKFEDLKNAINKKFPDSKILDAISEMGMWAERNPGKTAAIVGVLTAIAGLAAGPVGGAIAGQILRGSVELLKGEKLSTAIGKGVKTAAYGFIAGKTFELIGDALKGGLDVVKDAMFPGARLINMQNIFDEVGGEMGSRFANFEVKGLVVKPEDVSTVQTLFKDAASSWKAGDYNQSALNWNALQDFIDNTANSAEYIAAIAADKEKRDMIAQAATGAKEVFKFLGAAAQGAVAGAGVKGSLQRGKTPSAESRRIAGKKLSEGQVYLVFKNLQRLDEGPMDLVKKAGAKLSQMGTNLANKVTADKLNSAWQKAGAPTDSNQLADFLGKQGVDAGVIDQVYKGMQLPAPGQQEPTLAEPAMDFEQVKKLVLALPTDRKVRLLTHLQGGKKQIAKSPTQSEIDADRERIMGPTSDSIIRRAPSLAERKTK